MASLLIVLLLVWVVGIPLAIFLSSLMYPRYVRSIVLARQRWLERHEADSSPAPAAEKPKSSVIVVRRSRWQRRRAGQGGQAPADRPSGSLGSGRRPG